MALTKDALDHNWYVKALETLCPKRTNWKLTDDNILTWGDTQPDGFIKPTLDEIQNKADDLRAEYDAKQYQRDRAPEYPPIGDQLDALWKGGDEATEMLAKVQAVKEKYPKP